MPFDPRHHPGARPFLTRREMLRQTSTGFGWLALTALMADKAYAGLAQAGSETGAAGAAAAGAAAAGGPLAARAPDFAPKVKNVIFCFMSGGDVARRLVRPQAAAGGRGGRADAVPDRADDVQSGRQHLAQPVGVHPLRQQRHPRQRALPAHGRRRRRADRHPLDDRAVHGARPGELLLPLRHAVHRLPEHGGLGHLRPRDREPEPARLRRPPAAAASRSAASTSSATASCRPCTRAR